MHRIAPIVAILAALLNTSAAHAHASLIRSDPADWAVIARAPPWLTLTFNEPVSPIALRLVRPNGNVVELEGAAQGAVVSAALPADLARGTHLLSWRVISADGHPVGGAMTFSIGEPNSAPASSGAKTDLAVRGAIWLSRLMLYIGLFVGIGGAFYTRWVASAPPSRPVRMTLIGALECGLLAALLSVGLQGLDVLELPLSGLGRPAAWGLALATTYGWTLGIAIVALALALAALSTTKSMGRWLAAVALAGIGLALAASGHASTAGPEFLTRPTVFLHGVAVAFWVGALLPLAAALRSGSDHRELMQFSRIIPLPVLTLIVSGFVLAIIQLRQLDALWTTAYGLVLSCKLAVVGVLLALAVANRRLTPRIAAGEPKSSQRLVRSIWAELALVALILGLVASWRFTPPPRSLLAVAMQPVRVHIHTETAMADLRFGVPGIEGRQIAISILDGQFRPLPAREVTLVLSKPGAGIEPLRLPATKLEEAAWRVSGVRAPLSGLWHASVEILISDFEKISVEDDVNFSR